MTMKVQPFQIYLAKEPFQDKANDLDIADRRSLLLLECKITQSRLYAANSMSHPRIPSA